MLHTDTVSSPCCVAHPPQECGRKVSEGCHLLDFANNINMKTMNDYDWSKRIVRPIVLWTLAPASLYSYKLVKLVGSIQQAVYPTIRAVV